MKRIVVALFLFFYLLGVLSISPAVFAAVGSGTSKDESVGASVCSSTGNKFAICKECFDRGGAWTALGCLGGGSAESPGGKLNDFIRSFLLLGTGLGGGIAFLLILYSGFQRIISAGNPEKLHEAKELMTAAISGLLLIIFSVFLLRLIGVDILQLPGLESGGGVGGGSFKR